MFKSIGCTTLIATGVSLLMNVGFYMVCKPPVIATVDVMSVTSQFIKNEARKNRSNHEKEVVIRAFSHQLETALHEISASNSLILMPKEAVIQGAHDYTKMLNAMMTETKS